MIIFVLGGAAGFLLSSLAGHFLGWMPFRFLRGADRTVGASAGIFALIGALAYYGRRTGSSAVRTFITTNAVIWILWGVLMPGIDNYAHAGGFLGGYAARASWTRSRASEWITCSSRSDVSCSAPSR